MAPGVNPVMELVKLPVPVPSVVLNPAVTGVGVVLQQTPRLVIAAPPSLEIVPPLVAVVEAIAETTEVVMVDNVALVAELIWLL